MSKAKRYETPRPTRGLDRGGRQPHDRCVGELHDWASANQKLSPHTVETQLRFLTEDLRNAFCKIGAEISAANTEEEATRAFKPYADKLAALVRG